MTLRRRSYLVEGGELLTADKVKGLRKDFLTLMKNVKVIVANKDIHQIDKWRSAMIRWGVQFEKMLVQIRRDIEGRVRVQSGNPEWNKPVDEADAAALLRDMGDVWAFSLEATGRIPGSPMDYYRDYNRRNDKWYTDDRILDDQLNGIEAWERRIRTKSRKTWRWLDDVARWTQQTGLHSGGGEPVQLSNNEKQNTRMAGFQVQLKDHAESDTSRRMVKDLERGLAYYRKRASRILPHMLRATLPFVLDFSDGQGAYAARYEDDHISINIWGAIGAPREVAHVIAHEMGHHVWHQLLSGQAMKAWSDFVRGSNVKLNLRDIVKKWNGKSDKEMKKRDPVLALQLDTLMYNPGTQHLNFYGISSIRRYLEKGGDPVVSVPSRPITGYAGKNPEEAFCEALGRLVAYGSRTVLPSVRAMMQAVLPRLKVESVDLRHRQYLEESAKEFKSEDFKIDLTGPGLTTDDLVKTMGGGEFSNSPFGQKALKSLSKRMAKEHGLSESKVLSEMAALPSLKQLQQAGNKKPASKKELLNARKRALRLKSPDEAREAAKDAWETMKKRQIIQVFLDREAELINPKRPVPKPLFMDKKIIKWSKLDRAEKEGAIRWLAGTKTEVQLTTLIKQAKISKRKKITPDSTVKVEVHEAAMKEWKKQHKDWQDTANKTNHYFGR